MLINTDLEGINCNDTIVLANNRQVLAFKNTWKQQKDVSQLPKILSWKEFLKNSWLDNNIDNSTRFISNIESRYLLSKAINKTFDKVDDALINEVVKNYDYVSNHLINIKDLEKSGSWISELFSSWIKSYNKTKIDKNLIDLNDLANLIKTDNKSIYLYGFKNLTPLQQQIFDKYTYQILKINSNNKFSTQTYNNTSEEIIDSAIWAKTIHQEQPNKSIAIVVPDLQERKHQINKIFDEVFDSRLVETHNKKFNISLGSPLIKNPIVQELFNLLNLSIEINIGKVSISSINQALSCVYAQDYKSEKSNRILSKSKILALEKQNISINQAKIAIEKAPVFIQIIEKINNIEFKQDLLENHLLRFNELLNIWGFTTDRALSSSEFQILKKYNEASLELNKISNHTNKISIGSALKILKNILTQTVFQAQSGKNQIQILGSLEAEGLNFDHARVISMSASYLPTKINTPKFIPTNIAVKHKVVHSSYELIATDSKKTLENLKSLSANIEFSYAKQNQELELLPTPLLDFPSDTKDIELPAASVINTNIINDTKATNITNTEVRSGVSILKDQMACAFKGFVHRLDIDNFDVEHIGLNRLEQGNIIHKTLEYIYQDVKSYDELIALTDSELTNLINSKINTALKHFNDKSFTAIETKRIKHIIDKFIAIDKTREGFEVISTEQVLHADVAGLKFNTRLDRIDKMPNGDSIVFDYKTGDVSVASWCGNTINEPQLPIYATTFKTDGAAFIKLNSGKIEFKGLSRDDESLPKSRKTKNSCTNWDEQLEIWQDKLNSASANFQTGCAEVLPNKGSCDYCEYELLCRVEK